MITIKGHNGQKISITVERYERENTRDIDDANWLVGGVDLLVPPFNSKFSLNLETYDIHDFFNQLEKCHTLLSGKAIFTPIEEQIQISCDFYKTGGVLVKGLAKIGGDQGVWLERPQNLY